MAIIFKNPVINPTFILITDAMLRRYLHFKMSEAVWGSKASIRIPFQTTVAQIGPTQVQNALALALSVQMGTNGLESTPVNEPIYVTIEEVNEEPADIGPEVMTPPSTKEKSLKSRSH